MEQAISVTIMGLLAFSVAWLSFSFILRRPAEQPPPVPWGLGLVLGLGLLYLSMQIVGGLATVAYQVWDKGNYHSITTFVKQFKAEAQVNAESVNAPAPEKDQPAANPPAPPAAAKPAPLPEGRMRRITLNLWFSSLATLMWLGFALLVLRGITDDPTAGTGWHRTTWASDVRLGVLGFLAAAPPSLMLQITLRLAFPQQAKAHVIEQLLTSAKEHASSELPWMLALMAFAAVVVAPLAEEFFFRVLLQGSLENLETRVRQPRTELTSAELTATDSAVETPSAEPRRGLWAVLCSSLIFAAVHLTQWPDPLALFPFALMLGYLFYRTHRWLPSVIMHACLNGFSMAMLTLSLYLSP